MEELDTVSNMKRIVLKSPYKLREKWCNKAYELREERNHRARILDLICFIGKQACIAADPLCRWKHFSRDCKRLREDQRNSETQRKMPVTANILKQNDLEQWAYLSTVKLPSISAKVELLIETNAPKLLEPCEVINCQVVCSKNPIGVGCKQATQKWW